LFAVFFIVKPFFIKWFVKLLPPNAKDMGKEIWQVQ
jgi:hypothetical protein